MKGISEVQLTVEGYIAAFPGNVQQQLDLMRKTIRSAAPKAEEMISYKMPAYKQNGMLVYFAAFKNHIGFYAMPTGHAAFKKDLAVYKQGKGSVQFPIDQPLPLKLIRAIVQFRVKENAVRDKAKKQNAGKKK